MWFEFGIGGFVFAWAFQMIYRRILRLESGLRDTIGLVAFVARASLRGEDVDDDILERLIKTSKHPRMSDHLIEFNDMLKALEKRKQA